MPGVSTRTEHRARVASARGIAVGLLLVIAGACSDPLPSQTPNPTASPSPHPTPTPSAVVSPSPKPEGSRCPLTGLPVDHEIPADTTTLLVQIENNPFARPPANLSLADMVIEAPVEGDVTRYSALFLCETTIGLSGPIRSARYYNVDLWQDLHVLTIAFGASGGAVARFREAGMPIVNGINGGWEFFSRGVGAAPHNLYGDLEAIRSSFGKLPALDARAADAGILRPPFRFSATSTLPAGPSVASITIRTNRTWVFGWDWNAATGLWTRIEGGEPLTDRTTGQTIAARAVVVQRVRQDIVYGDPDPGGNARRYQHLVGSGDAMLFIDGQSVPLHWSRPTADDHTTWTVAATGDELVLPPGRVWWEVVPLSASVTLE